MKTHIDIELCAYEGDAYQMGLKHAKHLKGQKNIDHYLSTYKQIATFNQDVQEIKLMLSEFCPSILDELSGVQEGLGISEEDTFQLFAGYDMPKLQGMGCSSYITNEFYVRNYDFHPQFYDGCFISFYPTNGKSTHGNSQLIIGRLDGMNVDGLVVGLHFVNNDSYVKGFLCSTIVRIVLEKCSSVPEALDLLHELPHAASYNYSLLDKHGNAAVAECTPNRTSVRRGETVLFCTNHFQNKSMETYNRPQVSHSYKRIHAMQDLSVPHDVKEIHQFFAKESSPLFYKNYDEFFGTLHTVSYIPNKGEALLTAGGGKETNRIHL